LLTHSLFAQDKHVVEKHKQIYPRKQELDLVLSLSDKTERALKKVSDKLCTKVRDEMP
jgi:hypothetical protein